MTDLPKVMTDIEIIILSVVLAFIATVLFSFLFWIIRLYIWVFKNSYQTICGFKRQLDNGEITEEEYNSKVRAYNEKCKREIGRNG
jgi:cell division protein FtsB